MIVNLFLIDGFRLIYRSNWSVGRVKIGGGCGLEAQTQERGGGGRAEVLGTEAVGFGQCRYLHKLGYDEKKKNL